MLLSIIIPVYNAEKFIKRCIDSIITQSKGLNDLELVIINDGSTDGSAQILKSFKKEYDFISLIEQSNSGEGHTRNVGLENANGKYIWFIDADDYIEGEVLPNIYNTLNEQEPEVIMLGYKTVDLEGVQQSEVRFEDAVLTIDELIQKSLYTNTVWSKVIKTELIKNNQIRFDPAVKTATDFDFSFRVLYFSKKVATLKDISINYVVNPDSISNIRTSDHLERLAKDSVIVGNNISNFLITNETNNLGREKIFRPWLNNYLYGLMFSLFRFNYNNKFIGEIIASLKNNNNYPIDTNYMGGKKKLFTTVANNKAAFLLASRIRNVVIKS